MRAKLLVVLAGVALPNIGCVLPVVVPRADSVLTVEPCDGSAVAMGFRYAYVRRVSAGFAVEAQGDFPREHETWVFWHLVGTTMHPYPDYARLVRVTCRGSLEGTEPQPCRVQLLLQRGWPGRSSASEYDAYEGAAELRFEPSGDAISTELANIRLGRVGVPTQTLCVVGQVIVKPPKAGTERSNEQDATFELLWQRATKDESKGSSQGEPVEATHELVWVREWRSGGGSCSGWDMRNWATRESNPEPAG